MNTAVISIKTDPKLKKEAQRIASELGFSLSAILNAYLKYFIRAKAVNFTLYSEQEKRDRSQIIEMAKKEKV